MKLNDWSEKEANRAARLWGHKQPQYTKDAFGFICDGIGSWLDLGCGFGRFMDWLEYESTDPDYIGYDSSKAMTDIFKESYPAYAPRIFVRDITQPINNPQEGIICNAVLIHLDIADQDKILKNVLAVKPRKFVFDINSPSEQWLKKGQSHFVNYINGCEGKFRMTWQSHYTMTRKVLATFKSYDLMTKFYPINVNRYKVVYFLERRGG